MGADPAHIFLQSNVGIIRFPGNPLPCSPDPMASLELNISQGLGLEAQGFLSLQAPWAREVHPSMT